MKRGVGDHAHLIAESDGLTDLIQGYFFPDPLEHLRIS